MKQPPICHCGKDGHAVNSINCPIHGDENRTVSVKQIKEIKTELLAWAGLHRGSKIDESVMPRFHEIIDELTTLCA